MIIKMPILEHTPTKFETVQYFTTEKLKDIVDNPKGKIGTKAQLEELKVYLLDELTQEARRSTSILYKTGIKIKTNRKELLEAYKSLFVKDKTITNYKLEVEFIQHIEWNT